MNIKKEMIRFYIAGIFIGATDFGVYYLLIPFLPFDLSKGISFTCAGIAAENMGKIFEGFFRVDTPYSRITEGTGLGLFRIRKIVTGCEGRVWAESEGKGKGARFVVELPVYKGSEPVQDEPKQMKSRIAFMQEG